MLTLIELFEETNRFSNLLSWYVLKPDELIVMIDSRRLRPTLVKQFDIFRRDAGLNTSVRFLPCDLSDITPLADKMRGLIAERGSEACVIDTIGGSEQLLLAVGLCCAGNPGLRVLSHRRDSLCWLWGPEKGESFPVLINMTIRQAIAFAGGELLRCGHADWRKIGDDILDIIPAVFRVYMDNRPEWPDFVLYLQRLRNDENKTDALTYTAPVRLTVNPASGRKVLIDTGILSALTEAGAVSDFQVKSGRCTVRFASEMLLKYLCDTGAWLELYILAVIEKERLFSSYEINPVVSWDNDADSEDTINEVDLIAANGLKQVFISCKTGVPDNAALNEIAAITRRFGTRFSRAVLATACDLDKEAPAVYHRALTMGIQVIDAGSLEKSRLIETLKSIF